jgi:hypothetical protein
MKIVQLFCQLSAYWAIGRLKKHKQTNFCATFLQQSLYLNFDKRNGWASFWAIFSQTNLVTLTADLRHCHE